MTMADCTLFVDESGNAGMNYLDASQPVHVSAGFLVCNEHLGDVAEAVRAHLEGSAREQKGTSLLPSASGRQRALEFLEAVGNARALPFFVVMERRFSIAGKLVDVFLDPMHHGAADWLPTTDVVQRMSATERLAELADAKLLDAFAGEYRQPSEAGFRRVLEPLVARLRNGGEERLAASFEGALSALTVIVEAEDYSSEKFKHGQWAALNVPSVKHLLGMVDRVLDGTGRRADVVHDETREFGPALAEMVRSARTPGAPSVDVPFSDGRLFRALLRNLDTFTMRDSAATPGLQAADVLAGAVNRVVRKALTGARFDESLLRLAAATLPALIYEEDDPSPRFAGVYGSPRLREALQCVLMALMRRDGSVRSGWAGHD